MAQIGKLLIFNHSRFAIPQRDGTHKVIENHRKGTEQDVLKLAKVFGKYGVRYKELKDKNCDEIKEEMAKIQARDFSNEKCFVIAILSHGKSRDNILTYSCETDKKETYNIQADILAPLTTNRSLSKIPIFVLVQACMNDEILPDQQKTDAIESEINEPSRECDIQRNINVYYSTTEGFVSMRDPECGSIFIQEFCECFDRYGDRLSIGDIMIETAKKVIKIKTPSGTAAQYPTQAYQNNEYHNFIFGEHQQK